MYAEVIIDIAHSDVDRIFEYRVPENYQNTITIGMRVLVPFGYQKKPIEGYVIGLEDYPEFDIKKIKDIVKPVETYPAILPQLVKLALWMRKKYHCLLVDALRVMIPAEMRGQRVKEKTVRVVSLLVEKRDYPTIMQHIRLNAIKQKAVLELLMENPHIEMEELEKVVGGVSSTVRSLEKRGWIRIEERVVSREPYSALSPACAKGPELTFEQRQVIRRIIGGIQKREGIFLLHGITGSGKTEVYMNAIQYAIQNNMSAIVLVPEISLTPQMVERFRRRFGSRVAVLHSRLSIGERYDEWRKIRFGKVSVAIGARSAIFAPFDNLGLIIIDEEHEQSYRSDTIPRYDACTIAKYRCINEKAVLVMGSATPSLNEYYHCLQGESVLLELPNRVYNRPLPHVQIVDMREELAKGNRSIFSTVLYNEMVKTLEAGEQIILFINRRGYSTFVSCRECGYVVKCDQCDVSLTYHQGDQRMKCHYCGKETMVPVTCPSCGSRYIKFFGAGTQKVEEEVAKVFKGIRMIRMDNDTTQTKDAHFQLLQKFKNGEAQVLIGTQMIAKGLDFPNVTLVGVIAADTTLNLPDYRSAEKTFQLITQVAGRAGRDAKSGKVIVQTYSPQHYSILKASRHDYKGFYEQEIQNRQKWQYPPFTVFLRFLLQGENEDLVEEDCTKLMGEVKQVMESFPSCSKYILYCQCMPAPLARVKGKYRWQILIKLFENQETLKMMDDLYNHFQGNVYRNSLMSIETNPVNMA